MTAIGVTPKDDRELEEKDNALEAEEETEEDLDQEQVDEERRGVCGLGLGSLPLAARPTPAVARVRRLVEIAARSRLLTFSSVTADRGEDVSTAC